uniref:ABC transporter domain-containing protein n=1 Tax=Yersinia enterocolitica W22703 TaxID=913028 RepID=F4MV89_YEREN|nr:hypothetical protein YEW_GJ27330 [Yersinia enterocolitica W22703]
MNGIPHLITLEGVEKSFPGLESPAVASLTTEIHSGAVTGLVGPDGAGKTTLLRMLAGLLKPSHGKLTVVGLDPVENDRQLHSILGYMPQKFGLYEDLTVMENLTLYADLRGVTGEQRRQTFERLLTFTDLTRFTERLAGKLSGGMKQNWGWLVPWSANRKFCCWMSQVSVSIPSHAASYGAWFMSWRVMACLSCGVPPIWMKPSNAAKFCCSMKGSCFIAVHRRNLHSVCMAELF